jgi:hypothetical protein
VRQTGIIEATIATISSLPPEAWSSAMGVSISVCAMVFARRVSRRKEFGSRRER